MRPIGVVLVLALTVVGSPSSVARAAGVVHAAVGPGLIYPADGEALRTKVRDLFAAAAPAAHEGRLVACVVPHSNYDLSGIIAAHAFKHLTPGQYDKVLVLAPSRHTTFEGCSIASVQGYATPLGIVPVDLDTVKWLSRCPLIAARALRYQASDVRLQVHEREYSIEAVLPFLQERLGRFLLIPVLVSELLDDKGKVNENIYDLVADTIRPVIDDRTLIVVSAEFTAYGNDFSYRPFRDNVPERIQQLDYQAFELIMRHDFEGLRIYLGKTGNPIMGREALLLLTKLLPAHTQARVLAYVQSGEITGNMNRSVSYAAINFYDPARSPAGSNVRPENQGRRESVVLKMKGSENSDQPPQREISGAPAAAPAPNLEEGSGATTIMRMKGPSADGEPTQRELSGAPIQPLWKPLPDNGMGEEHLDATPSAPAALTPPGPSNPAAEADNAPPLAGVTVPAREPSGKPESAAAAPPPPPTSETARATPEGIGFEEWAGLDKGEPVVVKLEGAANEAAPVVLKMKGSKTGRDPVRIEVYGAPVLPEKPDGTEGSGHVTYMSGPRKEKATPDQEETPER